MPISLAPSVPNAASVRGSFSPICNPQAMNLHPEEISRAVAPGAHAVLLADRAGRHIAHQLKGPKTITPVLLPSQSPELNPVENIRRYMRRNRLSNRIFKNYEDEQTVLGRPGGDLLSRALRRSTIGAEGINGRVRDGIGFRPLAITTRPAKHGLFRDDR